MNEALTTRLTLAIALVATSPTLACHGDQPGPTGGNPQPPPAWQLVWHDEFDGAALDTTLDTTQWVRETGGNGWGNNELEFYTDWVENAQLDNGSLVIKTRHEPVGNEAYWPGNPDTTTVFPQTMRVDYVRVYQR